MTAARYTDELAILSPAAELWTVDGAEAAFVAADVAALGAQEAGFEVPEGLLDASAAPDGLDAPPEGPAVSGTGWAADDVAWTTEVRVVAWDGKAAGAVAGCSELPP